MTNRLRLDSVKTQPLETHVKDGLYKVHFKTPLGEGFGVAALLNGKVRGGDGGIYYLGSYATNGDEFTAEITTNRYANIPGGSVFGVDKVNLTLRGKSNGLSAQVVGQAKEAPGVTFQASLAWIAD